MFTFDCNTWCFPSANFCKTKIKIKTKPNDKDSLCREVQFKNRTEFIEKINAIPNFPFTLFNSWLGPASPTWSAWKWQHQGATIWSCQNKGLLKILEVVLKIDANSWNFRHLSAFKTLIRWMEISLWRAEHSDMQWLHLVGNLGQIAFENLSRVLICISGIRILLKIWWQGCHPSNTSAGAEILCKHLAEFLYSHT